MRSGASAEKYEYAGKSEQTYLVWNITEGEWGRETCGNNLVRFWNGDRNRSWGFKQYNEYCFKAEHTLWTRNRSGRCKERTEVLCWIPEKSRKIYRYRSKCTKRRNSLRPSGHGQNNACKGNGKWVECNIPFCGGKSVFKQICGWRFWKGSWVFSDST